MRTLKKTLSLVLALVLCFGLVGTAFAGNFDKYTDANEVGAIYKEAADVMLGMGIISGMSATEIGANGALTREQAAKIVAYLSLGKVAADALSANAAPFNDVAADRWSAGYIAYCAEKGILNGYGNGNFGPSDELTGYQFAKMLLCALGYGQAGEYTVGGSWSIAVAQDALPKGIFTGDLTAAVNDPITRQQAMLMAFNCRTLNTQKYLDVLKIYQEQAGSHLFAFNGLTQTSGELNGNAARSWSYNGKVITDMYTSAKVAVTITNGTSIDDLCDPNKPTYNAAVSGGRADNVKYYVNGELQTGAAPTPKAGALVEIYTNADKKIVNVNITQKTVATVDTVTVTPRTNLPSNVVVSLVGASPLATDPSTTITGYEGLNRGDVILYYKVNDVIRIEKAASFVGQMTSYKVVNGKTTYTISGKNYTASGLIEDADAPTTNANDFNKDTTYYLDNYGYIVAAVPVAGPTIAKNYGLVLHYGWNPGVIMNGTTDSSRVQMATMDGKVAIYDTATKNGQPVELDIKAVGLYEYVMNANNVVTRLEEAGTAATLSAQHVARGNTITLADGSIKYLTSNTQVIFYGEKAIGKYAPTNPVTSVIGYSNVPAINQGTSVTYVLNNRNTSVVDVLFVNAAAGSLATAPATAYIVDPTPSVSVETTTSGALEKVYSYNVYVDGVATTMKSTTDDVKKAGLYTYTTANGYTTFDFSEGFNKGENGMGEVLSYVEGTYIVAGTSNYKTNASTAFYLVNNMTRTVTPAAISLVTGKTVKVTQVIEVNGVATAIYYTIA